MLAKQGGVEGDRLLAHHPEKAKARPPMKRDHPAEEKASRFRCRMLIRCLIQTASMATRVEEKVASMRGEEDISRFVAPICAR